MLTEDIGSHVDTFLQLTADDDDDESAVDVVVGNFDPVVIGLLCPHQMSSDFPFSSKQAYYTELTKKFCKTRSASGIRGKLPKEHSNALSHPNRGRANSYNATLLDEPPSKWRRGPSLCYRSLEGSRDQASCIIIQNFNFPSNCMLRMFAIVLLMVWTPADVRIVMDG
jgi:hypothetical protein